jgi:hypothetical protein
VLIVKAFSFLGYWGGCALVSGCGLGYVGFYVIVDFSKSSC